MLKKTSRKLLSALLALSMMAGLLGGAVWADEPAAESVSAPTAAATPGEVSTAKPAAAPAAATPAPTALVEGEGYTWDDATGTLTITASTEDYTSSTASNAPYYQYRSDIKKVVVDGADIQIGDYAFYNYSSLTDVEIRNAAGIGSYAFSSSKVTTLNITVCGDIGDYAFRSCSNLQSVTIGTCGSIGDRAFGSCSSLQNVIIGTCGDMDDYAFQNPYALTDVTIGTCGNIGSNAFAGASKLACVDITKCGDIADDVFSSKSALLSVSIGECGNIGSDAFSDCTALSQLTLGTCGNIGKNAFKGCTALDSLSITKCGDIAGGAFVNSVKHITIGECGTVAGYAFADIGNPFGDKPLVSVEIDSCTSIAGSAFYNMTNLETVKIGKTGSIGSTAFRSCSALKTVEIGECPVFGSNAFAYAGSEELELTLRNCAIESTAFDHVKTKSITLDNVSSVGDYAFQFATVHELTLSNIGQMGKSSFLGCKELTTLTLSNITEISEGAFRMPDDAVNESVTIVNLSNVETIGNYAFKNFTKLETVNIDGSCGYVGAHAFSGCDTLKNINISDETRLGYSDVLVNQGYIHDRVEAILANGFSLYDPETVIETIAPAGWTSVRTGEANAAEAIGDTQLTKEAKWADAEKTVADVRIQAYYTTARQMDFIFVADASNSMSGFGSADAMNSNFYNMQSKMMDVADELLSAPELNTRIAFSTFGEKPETDHALSRFFEKGEQAEAHDFIWNDIVNYESNTNYAVGLAGALELAEENVAAGRNTTVIFISDGQPFHPTEVPESYYGVAEANAIRALGVQIVSVLQQVPAGSLASSQENMAKISDQTFSSTDLAGFSTAINDAVEYALTTYTLTDTVDPAFTLDESSIEASAGTVTVGKDAAGNTTITWTLTDVPFEAHTLTFKENLNADERGIHPTGELDTNEGAAVFCSGDEVVNTVATPVLSRGTSLAVNKVWKDDAESVRPTSIDVTLLRDGEAFEKVTLNAGGNWAHTWPALDEAYAWSVEETVVPADYDAAVTNEGGAWTITNTYTREVPTTPTTPTTPSTPVTATPQTGDASNALLWAALAAFGAVGLAGCTLAALRRRAR